MQANQALNTASPKRQVASQDQLDTPNKRKKVQGERASSVQPVVERRDKDFWYSDGKVVLRIGDTLFKLYRSRLEKYCIFFQQLFAADADAPLSEILDGCPVYHMPPDLSLKGFKNLLNALETPLEFVDKPPSQTLAISLLHASHTLACDSVYGLAKSTLCDIWSAQRLPAHDGSDAHGFREAIYMIKLARLFDIPGVLKRASYELASSQEFWDALAADRQSVGLPEVDIFRLYDLRLALGEMWRRFVLAAPGKAKEDGKVSCVTDCNGYGGGCRMQSYVRSKHWAGNMEDLGQVEAGAMDPFRYNIIKHKKAELLGDYWCASCLEDKEERWKTQRAEWWGVISEGVLKPQ
ncbi:hypothetical protein L226DRAFT_533816 [Lentinus tigrinus ALCF2SS1-7]|uniref:BTB domain-containing protein n=1 Tax=Lentinus tigrinus ALCF2SS1-6 TaxID=1328759 RepID=A0A5C2SGK2_9APHY|nr:hypothetical protein L227DRAFT_547412 [Lentinus tigrinus ALCF2SS1-6]RPD75740.1 hypothetical protein L226DRAFT_533816 [Lentinus tigrinus ALCF2SS1-7]